MKNEKPANGLKGFMLLAMLAMTQSLAAQEQWELTWSDEFERDGRPDTATWNYERGFVRNHEAQWYQEENAWQQDGVLIIEARREHRPNPTYRRHGRYWGQQREWIDYTSACLTTKEKRTFLYGRLEVRARIPTAGGAWPAIWTLGSGQPWPSCGEVDVMEYYRIGGMPHILANVAWGNDEPYGAVWNSRKVPFAHFTARDSAWAQQFHVWRMDWDESAIRLFLDDELLNEVSLVTTVNGAVGHYSNPFHQPQYILLNLALGGQNGGPIDDSALPLRYEIDYVRLYEPHSTPKGDGVNGSSTEGGKLNGLMMPPWLKAGDRVAVVSPSSTPDSMTVVRGCQTLREWGYVPVVGRHALKRYHGFAGTADERTEDLLWALSDTTIRAVMCSRGGDGAVQVLQRLPLDVFARNPKWLIGFSDATALHSAAVSAGVMSIHGSMCHAISSMEGRDTVSVTLRRLLEGQLPDYRVAHHPLDQVGEATGILVGGNMSVFCGLAGSAYDFLNRADEGLILFFEDTKEEMTKVDRMLHLLEIRGVLPRLRGIIVGRFSDYKRPENDFADMYEMLHEYLQHYDFPVCYGFPVGHARLNNFPMVEGCQVRLTVGSNGTRLQFIPSSPIGR